MKIFIPEITDDLKEKYAEQKPTDIEVRLSSYLISNSFSRNKWIKIEHGKHKIYRIVKGSNIKGLSKDHIWLSYDSKIELGVQNEEKEELTISKPNPIEVYVIAPWNTPDLTQRNMFRVALVISIISVVLGIVSLLN